MQDKELYFKDCFTEDEGKINAEFNRLTVQCFNSANNNFSLDCEGNLSVNSITTKLNKENTKVSVDDIYPIGSIYMSVNGANPSTLFGGTWVQIKGRYLIGTGNPEPNTDNYFGEMNNLSYDATVGSKGGQESHQLTVSEMPTHSHRLRCDNFEGGAYAAAKLTWGTAYNGFDDNSLESTGNNLFHNNMPPYFAVYMWQRVE